MAITAWSAKVSSSLICCLSEGSNLRAANHDRSDGNSLTQQWRDEHSAGTDTSSLDHLASGNSVSSSGHKIMNMNRLPVDKSTAGQTRASTDGLSALPSVLALWPVLRRHIAEHSPSKRSIRASFASQASPHFRPPHPAPAEYPSANWQSRPRFRSLLSVAPTTSLSSWNSRTFSMAITA